MKIIHLGVFTWEQSVRNEGWGREIKERWCSLSRPCDLCPRTERSRREEAGQRRSPRWSRAEARGVAGRRTRARARSETQIQRRGLWERCRWTRSARRQLVPAAPVAAAVAATHAADVAGARPRQAARPQVRPCLVPEVARALGSPLGAGVRRSVVQVRYPDVDEGSYCECPGGRQTWRADWGWDEDQQMRASDTRSMWRRRRG